MGDVIYIADYLEQRREKVAKDHRAHLHTEFSKAASYLFWLDPTRLAQDEGTFKGWDDHPSITTSLGRARFAFSHAQTIARYMQSAYSSLDEHTLQLGACEKLEKITQNLYLDMTDGVPFPVVRREWDRAVQSLVEQMTDQAITQLSASRSAAPNPRNA